MLEWGVVGTVERATATSQGITGITNGTKLNLNLSPNVIGGSNDDTIFLHKLLLTDTHFSRLCKD